VSASLKAPAHGVECRVHNHKLLGIERGVTYGMVAIAGCRCVPESRNVALPSRRRHLCESHPYGLVIGPDRALYFCDLDNQRIRRLDLATHQTTVIAGNGQKAYGGDGGSATAASLNMPHEIQFDSAGNMYIAERDNHVVRKVEAKTGIISTFAGTGASGFSGDGGPATRALICDIGNHRIRQVDFASGVIETYGGTGERQPTPDGVAVTAPLNGPRTMTFDGEGNLYLALRATRSTGSRGPGQFIIWPAPASKVTRGMVGRLALLSSRVRRDWPMGVVRSMWPTLRAT
jgi:streptogramin lyase